MKNLLLALALATGFTAHAQITREHRYSSIVEPGKLSTGDVKYAGYVSSNATSGQVRIYNLNHSIYRQVPITVPNGARIWGIEYLSDKLFNTNAGLEFVLNVGNPSPSGSSISQTRIYDETGALLLSTDSTGVSAIYNTPTGTKMLLYNFDAGDAGTSQIFSLGGTLTTLRTVSGQAQAELAPAYPNPSEAEINLPYQVALGKVAELVVRDIAGRQVATYQVDNTFDHLRLNTRKLRSGVYFYTVDGGTARRFVVR